jgi:hypothetical protein
MSRSLLRRIIIDEGAESVEDEILDHHLENEDFGAMRLECIPVLKQVRKNSTEEQYAKDMKI